MTTKLADTRDMTIAQACLVFQEIALIEKRLARERALTEQRIARIKERHEEKIAADMFALEGLERELCQFIQGNPHMFTRPRAIKTDFGRFGLETVSNVEIHREDHVIEYGRNFDLDDIYEEHVVVKKAAVGKRLRAGEIIPGASLLVGERAFYKVDKALLDEARATATGNHVAEIADAVAG